MRYIIASALGCVILSGCENGKIVQNEQDTLPEVLASETQHHHTFEFNTEVGITDELMNNIISEMKTERGKGIENVSFIIVAKQPLHPLKQDEISKKISNALMHAGFMESRIINTGSCFYSDASEHIRIDALSYQSTSLGSGEWTSSIGDCDEGKDLPQKGYSDKYNLTQMVANKADLVSPRNYRGQQTERAIAALTSTAGGSSTASSESSNGK
ncbi:MAG: hypothetical protein E7015_02570 [Alphaproteobacteria bacterium]|nr:hypothetical protein [Alphaproteobacteria bacterium]